MADNVVLNPGAAGSTIATDDVGGIQFQKVKLDVGGDGVSAPVSNSNPVPVSDAGTTLSVDDGAGSLTVDGTVGVSGSVTVVDGGGSLTVDGTVAVSGTVPVTDNAGSLTVDNPALSVVGGGVEATALRVTLATDSTGVVSVDDNGGSLTVDGTVGISGTVPVTDNSGSLTVDAPVGTPVFVRLSDGASAITALPITDNAGSLTVDGTVAATQSGTWTIQVGNTPNTTPILASLHDGTTKASVADLTNANPLHVAIVDGAGNQVTSFGGTGGTSATDDAAFTPASGAFTPIGGIVTSDSVDSGDGGAFAMLANRQQKVTLYDSAGTELAVGGGTQYDEDTVHVSGDKLTLAGAVRRDTAASGASADGDRATLNVNSVGRLWTSTTVDSALPAGTNNIGDVDVLTLPALAAGTNNIGDVDVLTLPALPAGSNNIGDVDVLTLPALPAGSNNIGDVDVLSVVPGTGATALGKAIDSAAGSTDTGVAILGIRDDALSTLTPVEGDYVPTRLDSTGALWVRVTNGLASIAEDTAAVGGEDGIPVLAVRRDSASSGVGADGDFANLSVDSTGALRVTGGGGGTQFAEDAVAASGDLGNLLLAVRRDSASSGVSADGDYAALSVTSDGSLRVSGSAGTTQYTEDAASAGAESLVLMGAVRRDTAASSSGTDGDYSTINTDASGRVHVNVGVLPALVAGTANIGDVDVLTLPAIPAGTNNIGDVDVLTVPADPFGANADAASATGSISAKLRFIASTGIPVTGTVTVGSHAVTNAGTFVVQENGAALTALQLIDDTIVADDAAFTVGTTKVSAVGYLADEVSTDSVDEGDIGISRMTLDRKHIVTVYAHAAAGGYSSFKTLDLDETEEEVKATAGKVFWVHAINLTNAKRYLKFYNATAANVTVGTTTPVLTFPIPTNGDTNGTGFNFHFGDAGQQFDTAICVAATTGFADNDTGAPGANDVIVNLGYL